MAVSPEHKTRNNHEYNQEKHVCGTGEDLTEILPLLCGFVFSQ